MTGSVASSSESEDESTTGADFRTGTLFGRDVEDAWEEWAFDAVDFSGADDFNVAGRLMALDAAIFTEADDLEEGADLTEAIDFEGALHLVAAAGFVKAGTRWRCFATGAASSSDNDDSDSEVLSTIRFLPLDTARAAGRRLMSVEVAREETGARDLVSEGDASVTDDCLTGVGGGSVACENDLTSLLMSYSNLSFFQNSSGRRETRPPRVTERLAIESTGPSVSSAIIITSGCFKIERRFFFLRATWAGRASAFLDLDVEADVAREETATLLAGPLLDPLELREETDEALNLLPALTLALDTDDFVLLVAERDFCFKETGALRRGGG